MTRPLRAAFKVEGLKFRLAPVVWCVSLATLLLVTCFSLGVYALVTSGTPSESATKFRASMRGVGWDGLYSLATQISGVAVLLGVGVVASWCVGREFTEQTVVSLFALPVSRGEILLAKLTVLLLWATLLSVLLGALVFTGGVSLGLVPAAGLEGGFRLTGLGLLMSLAALPAAWVSSVSRGYLAGIGAVLGIVVFSQLAAATGAGSWMPWVSPVIWAGAAGRALQAQVTGTQLLLSALVGLGCAWATYRWWERAELGNGRG